MVAGGLGEEAHAIVDAAALGVFRAVIKPADAGKRDGGRAQRAGFERHVEVRARQPLLAERAGGLADDGDFGMGRHVVVGARAVAGLRHDRAVHDEHGADGHFAAFAGGAGLGQRDLHEAICHSGTNSS